MKLRYFLFLLILFLPSLALAGEISGVSFVNEPQSVNVNEPALLTAGLQYEGDSHPTACMELFSNSSTGQFSSNDKNWKSVDKLTINSNWSKRNFYYKDSKAGNYNLTIKIIPVSCSSLKDEKPQWTANQNITIKGKGGEDSGSKSSDGQKNNDSSGSGAVPYIPPEKLPSIKAYAGEDRILVAGGQAVFRGQAFGLKNESLENARYLWNFGDGSLKEGQNVTHLYTYPGEYIVVLNVSNGKYSASDRFLARVVEPNIYISEIKTGPESFIEFYNDSNEEIDLANWRFRQGQRSHFTFAKNTFIKGKGYLVIPVSSSGIIFSPNQGSVELLLPGGRIADTFNYSGVLKKGQSFSRVWDKIVISLQTPGAENAICQSCGDSSGFNSKPSHTQADSQESKMSGFSSKPVAHTHPPVIEINANKEEKAAESQLQSVAGATTSQPANVIAANPDKNPKSKATIYFLITLGMILFSAFGFIAIHRKSGV